MSAAIRDVRRGDSLDELELTGEDGRVVILHAFGVHPDERQRMREAALAMLAASGIHVVEPQRT